MAIDKVHFGIGEYVLCNTFSSVWNRERMNFGIRTTTEKSKVTCKKCSSKLKKQSPQSFLSKIQKIIENNRKRNEEILRRNKWQ